MLNFFKWLYLLLVDIVLERILGLHLAFVEFGLVSALLCLLSENFFLQDLLLFVVGLGRLIEQVVPRGARLPLSLSLEMVLQQIMVDQEASIVRISLLLRLLKLTVDLRLEGAIFQLPPLPRFFIRCDQLLFLLGDIE